MARLDPVRLDDYELHGPLGSGGMASVFDAIHKRTRQSVAIKLLDPSSRGSRELRERMAREAVLLASISSPYVSTLLAHGWHADQPFLVLERLHGETLGDVLRREGRLAPVRLVEWIEQLLMGVVDCHKVNVIHRDIKPANIFLERPQPGGEILAKLIDFGVARLDEIANSGASLTTTNHVIGSMGYMAPEQFESARTVGPKADFYAIGVVVFRAITGRLPFVAKTFDVLNKLKCDTDAPLVSSMPGVNPNDDLDVFVARALARDLRDRFDDASEMLHQWWRVCESIDGDAALPAIDVVFDDEEWEFTIVESLRSSGTNPAFRAPAASNPASGSIVNSLPVLGSIDDGDGTNTDPEHSRPTDRRLQAASSDIEPPSER